MSGYTPLFGSLTTGTLCGRWPDIGLWPILLSLSDKNGVVDVTPAYIAGVTGLTVDDVRACMVRFCEPDPHSRSAEAGGARLELLDEHRDWGWRIVNHGHYREKARKAAYDSDRTSSGADAERKRKERMSRDVPTRPDASRALPLSDTDTNKDSKRGRKRPPPTPKIPFPEDFVLDPDLERYAVEHLPDVDVPGFFESFRGKALAKGWAYANWRQAFQEFVRNCAPQSGHWAAGQYTRKSTNRIDPRDWQ